LDLASGPEDNNERCSLSDDQQKPMRPNRASSRWDAAVELLGKNDAYRVSGTMTNQVALRAHTEACERGG
jgi:hypothetical protein